MIDTNFLFYEALANNAGNSPKIATIMWYSGQKNNIGLINMLEYENKDKNQCEATVKILKFRTPEKFAVITLKFEQGGSSIE